ncbi:hypothetical protein GCM10022422_10310 [Flavobacterium ginsengisoli]|uniref:BIG2 domain-containing protein n=1 Tax=Flavobacterium ginsengisoli TaxID=871694 RepID=A0ABP7F2B1_9FLAO|nr:hypothetical protein [Flavobacterium ginsengisoli]
MKNLKTYFSILIISLATSTIFFACSNEDSQQQTSSSTKKEAVNKTATTNKSALVKTVCNVNGPTIVNINTPITYTYTNDSGTPANVTWVANPANLITINGSGSTITATFAAGFVSGSITATGFDGTALICASKLDITKQVSTCCTPILSASYICRGSGPSAGGAVDIFLPAGCNIDWSAISKIDVSFTNDDEDNNDSNNNNTRFTTTSPSDLYNKSKGTLTYPYNVNNNKIRLSFTNPQCVSVFFTATFYFNNGCPPVTATVETLGPLETSE